MLTVRIVICTYIAVINSVCNPSSKRTRLLLEKKCLMTYYRTLCFNVQAIAY